MRFFIYHDFIYHDVLFQKDFSTWKDVGCGCGKSNDHRPAMSAFGRADPVESFVVLVSVRFPGLIADVRPGIGDEAIAIRHSDFG